MDVMTISICLVLVILALASAFMNVLNRRGFLRKEPPPSVNTYPAFSIIISVHDNASELERNLPEMLAQDYPGEFEVVVVDESSTDETEDVIKRLRQSYHNLYSTFIPESSHYLSRRKLALTIGIKAAKHEWLIITDADCCPKSKLWLQAMARHCNDTNDIVLGYSNYRQTAKPFYRFEHLLTSCYAMQTALKGTAFRYNGKNLAVRKSVFMSHNGFLKNLRYLRGEYDFIVNEYAQKGRADVATAPEAQLVQDEPSRKQWRNEHVFYMETRRHLARKAANRIRFIMDNTMLHMNYLVQIAAITYSAFTTNWPILFTSAISIILTIVLRMAIAKKTLKLLGETLPLWSIPMMELRVMWQNMSFMIRYALSDKNDFIRK